MLPSLASALYAASKREEDRTAAMPARPGIQMSNRVRQVPQSYSAFDACPLFSTSPEGLACLT